MHPLLDVDQRQELSREKALWIQRNRLLQMLDGEIVLARVVEMPAEIEADERGERIELLGALQLYQRLVEATLGPEVAREPLSAVT